IVNDGVWADPLQSVTRQIAVSPDYFFSQLFEKIDYQLFTENAEPENDAGFLEKWLSKEHEARRKSQDFLVAQHALNDLTVVNSVMAELADGEQLHVGNSMPIRYVNALTTPDRAIVFCNRGTSGIDGSLSTAIGAALVNDCPTTLLIGDVSFLYDRNGLLINSLPQNLKIVVVNNGGGNIFRMIDGPAKQPELESCFETRHQHTARRTAEDAGMKYFSVNRVEDLGNELTSFRKCNQICLLEVFTDPEENTRVWKQFKRLLNP
ncbi:MAG TPA: thiamine pyrophosphate-dependent enzyme, partial [Dyadobacter sp.]|nr:thiamine pyrophosphate-dependent enzyme [Dyadobacter sp.]